MGLSPSFGNGVFVILRGYIDDSKDGKTFNISAVISHGSTWFYWELDWLEIINAKNKKLIAQGRKPISRYHASDCQFRYNDFEGWGETEKDNFFKELVATFEDYNMHLIGYSIDFGQLLTEIPEAASNPERFCYVIGLAYLMLEIGDFTLSTHRDAIISLIHDRCDHNGPMQDMFDAMLEDESFIYRNRFVTLAPMGWEHCVPLQCADIIAYENFKESQRLEYRINDKQRRSLDHILTFGKNGGRLKGFNPGTLRDIRQRIKNMSPEMQKKIFGA